ncbi:translocation and assembly module lipoprotein TamL [Neolewinella antarctica]|uniref:Outer membrane protein assembly factor BamA n=1 Tax=Neolewinella antarctica TaxID=442734 RepID=A0ABX0XAW0_9BACT|nr:BamA/TamA family outer membrane protein [Neolewinella antarctica]NJC26380.1 outer membrane protein assembly factor BamA [Neolewinella antarctica]
MTQPHLLFTKALRTCASALLLVTIYGCSITQYLPEDKYLYNGSSIEVIAPDETATAELTAEVTSVLNQNTNGKIPLLGYYGIYRWYKFEEKLKEKPEKFQDKEHWGEEPIFYDENVVETVNTLLENRASNEGYFNNESEWALDTNQSPPLISADYVLTVGQAYRLDSIRLVWSDSSIARRIDELSPETRLDKGERYELDDVKAERQRWENKLRQQGYYYLRADDFMFLADTVSGDHQVDMLGKLKDDIPTNHTKPQRISRINVYANADTRDTLNAYGPGDTIVSGGLHIICKECPLRPKIMDEAFQQREGDLYSPVSHQTTLKRLANYNTFRYIAMDYQPVPGSDSTLVMNAYMEPRLRRRFEGELGLSYNSADYFGPNVKLAYVNRNLLRGAELLRIEGEYALAQFLGGQGETRVPRSSIFGLKATLSVPRLWLPKKRKLIPRVTTSGSVIEIGGRVEALSMNLQRFKSEIQTNRLTELAEKLENDEEATENLSLGQFTVQFGYTWRRRVTTSHALNPLSIRLQNPTVSTEEVLDLARLSNLAPSVAGSNGNSRFDRMLVFSPNYTYTYDSRLAGSRPHSFFLNQFISGNVNNVFPVGSDSELRDPETSYYPLVETDARYYFQINKQLQIATRFHGGVAFPLASKRVIVPYFDLFSIGGPNSLRGFAPRQVGPGNTVPEQNSPLSFGGFGNLLLETSLEFRYKVNSLIELAVFADAGNIWTYKSELQPIPTDFNTRAFTGQLAVDAGIGFRFDLQFLVFRIDLAQPLQTAYGEEELKLLKIPYEGARAAPANDLRLVVAFGYPF